MSKNYKVVQMASLFKESKSSYYNWKKHPISIRQKEDFFIGKEIKEIFKDSGNTYGILRIQNELRKKNINCGKSRISRLMKQYNLHAKAKHKFITTTESSHIFKASPNLLNRNFNPESPNKSLCIRFNIHKDKGGLFISMYCY